MQRRKGIHRVAGAIHQNNVIKSKERYVSGWLRGVILQFGAVFDELLGFVDLAVGVFVAVFDVAVEDDVYAV